MYLHGQIHTHTRTCIHIHMHMDIHINTHTHTHTYQVTEQQAQCASIQQQCDRAIAESRLQAHIFFLFSLHFLFFTTARQRRATLQAHTSFPCFFPRFFFLLCFFATAGQRRAASRDPQRIYRYTDIQYRYTNIQMYSIDIRIYRCTV